jgi:hypothetical protein
MEPHLQSRPKKTPLSIDEQERIRAIAIEKIQALLLPNEGVKKIVLIGSSVKGVFGSYEAPGFRGSPFSDFDFIVFVNNTYKIPSFLEREPNGKPFEDEGLNLAYRIKHFVNDTYDAEVFFIREASLKQDNVCEFAEQAGIPMDEQSKNPFITVYQS